MERGLFLIHAVIGALVAAHATQKLFGWFGWFGGRGLGATAAFMEALGLIPGDRAAAAAGLAELVGDSCSWRDS